MTTCQRRLLITYWHLAPQAPITCKFCVEDLFVFLPDLLLVVLEQSLAQVAHLLHCEWGLVLSWGTWRIERVRSAVERSRSLSQHQAASGVTHRERECPLPGNRNSSQVKMTSWAVLCCPSALPDAQGHALPGVGILLKPTQLLTWAIFKRAEPSHDCICTEVGSKAFGLLQLWATDAK